MTNDNPTDTNQASEDEQAIMIGFLYGIQSDFMPDDEVRHRIAGFKHTQGYKEAIELIRTEKLKLLAEVRERVVGEDKYPAKESSDLMKQLSPNVRRCEWQNELRGEQRTLLDKLEAEL